MRAVEKLLTTKRLLAHLSRDYSPVAMYQTFCPEDIVLAHLIYSDLVHTEFKNIRMFYVDTGRTPDEVYLAIESLQLRYGNILTVYHPDTTELENFGAHQGFGANYYQRSTEIRFSQPLKRALEGSKGWIATGAGTHGGINTTSPRQHRTWINWDTLHQLPCFNPMVRWSQEEVQNYARHHGLTLLSTSTERVINTTNIRADTALEKLPAAVGLG